MAGRQEEKGQVRLNQLPTFLARNRKLAFLVSALVLVALIATLAPYVTRGSGITRRIIVATGVEGSLGECDLMAQHSFSYFPIVGEGQIVHLSRGTESWWVGIEGGYAKSRMLLYVVPFDQTRSPLGIDLASCNARAMYVQRNGRLAATRTPRGIAVIDIDDLSIRRVDVEGIVDGPYWIGDHCVVETTHGVRTYFVDPAGIRPLDEFAGFRIEGRARGLVIMRSGQSRVSALDGKPVPMSEAASWERIWAAADGQWYDQVDESICVISFEPSDRVLFLESNSGASRMVKGGVSFGSAVIHGDDELDALRLAPFPRIPIRRVATESIDEGGRLQR